MTCPSTKRIQEKMLRPLFDEKSKPASGKKPTPRKPRAAPAHMLVEEFDFDAAVLEIFEMYPEAKEHLHFYDLGRQRFVLADPEGARTAKEWLKDSAHTRERFYGYVQHYTAEGNSAVVPGLERGSCIMLNTRKNAINLMGPSVPLQHNVYFILDHELGHAVAENGRHNRNSHTLHECVADSFAALRHIQRFGGNTTSLEKLMLHRAQRLVSLQGHRHAEHFTGFTLEKILEIKDKADIQRLSPAQTKALATRMALAHTPNDEIVLKIAKAFKPFQQLLEQGATGDLALRKLAHIVLTTKDYETFKWGAPVLRGYMDGTLGNMTNGAKKVPLPATDYSSRYWQKAHQMLTAREFAFEKEDVLFGLHLPQTAKNDNAQNVNPARKTNPAHSGQTA
jgi:hypothetical protein